MQAAYDAVRAVIAPAPDGDRWYQTLAPVRAGAIVAVMETALGELRIGRPGPCPSPSACLSPSLFR